MLQQNRDSGRIRWIVSERQGMHLSYHGSKSSDLLDPVNDHEARVSCERRAAVPSGKREKSAACPNPRSTKHAASAIKRFPFCSKVSLLHHLYHFHVKLDVSQNYALVRERKLVSITVISLLLLYMTHVMFLIPSVSRSDSKSVSFPLPHRRLPPPAS